MTEKNMIDGIDYGPLACLIGVWNGDKGMDKAPEPDGIEENPFYESILFEAIGDVKNAESQILAALRYHQVVSRKSTDKVFHNETGYWMWDKSSGIVMQSLTIPRGVCLLAGGKASVDSSGVTILEVKAAAGDHEWGIIESPFMHDKARTLSFNHQITVSDNEMTYSETTELNIYGKTVDHTDSNILTRSG